MAAEREDALVQHAFDEVLQGYLKSNHRKKVEVIERAFRFAREAHKGVRRRSGEPYILHPIAVGRIASPCAEAWSPKMPPEIFVSPSTICATLRPNARSMSSTVYSVSSTTSCSRAAHIDVEPSPISWLAMRATAIGCRMYGSPDRRRTPLCAWPRISASCCLR